MINLTEKRSWSKRFNKLKVSLVSLGVVLKTTAVSQYVSLFGKFPKFVQKYFKPQKWYSMKSRSFVCLRESPACEAMWVIWRYCPPTLSSLFMFSQGFSIAINVLIFSSLTLGIIDGEFRQKRFKEEHFEVSLWKYSFKFCTSLYLWKWIIAYICASFKSRHKSFLASLSSKCFTQWGNTFSVWPRFLLNGELWIDAMSFQVYQSTQLKSEVRHFDYKAVE